MGKIKYRKMRKIHTKAIDTTELHNVTQMAEVGTRVCVSEGPGLC